MGNNSQFEVADSLLQSNTPRGKENTWTDIGEVEVVFTLFGRAMVLTAAEKKKMRRSRLLILLFLVVMLASAWQWRCVYLPEEKSPVRDTVPAFGLIQQNIELNLPPENVAQTTPAVVVKKAHKPRVIKPVISKRISPKPAVRKVAVKKAPAVTQQSVAVKTIVRKPTTNKPVLVAIPPSKLTLPANAPTPPKQVPSKVVEIKSSTTMP
ncbi:MAG: hypothetical protein R8K20_11815 [Gallionellaceae bacterium]